MVISVIDAGLTGPAETVGSTNLDSDGPSDSVLSQIRRAALGTAAGQSVVVVLLFVSSVAVARLLGPEGRGELARFVNAAAFAVLLADLGMSTAITFFLASRATSVQALWRFASRLYLLTLSIATVAFVAVVASPLRERLPQSLTEAVVVLALVLFLASSQAANWLASVLVADARFAVINIVTASVTAVGTVAFVALLAFRQPSADVGIVIGILIAVEAMRAGAVAVTVRMSRLRRAASDVQTKSSGVANRLLLRYSSLAYSGDVLQFLVYRLDMWIVDAYHGAAALGTYALAVTLAQLVWIVPVAIARVMFPYSAMPTTRGAAGIAARGASVAVAISAVCGVLGWLLSTSMLTSIFGDGFGQAPSLIGILLLGIVPFSGAKVLGNYLAGVNAVGLNTATAAAGLVLTIPLNLALVPSLGPAGAAWASAITYLAQTMLIAFFFLRRTGTSLRTLLGLGTASTASGT